MTQTYHTFSAMIAGIVIGSTQVSQFVAPAATSSRAVQSPDKFPLLQACSQALALAS